MSIYRLVELLHRKINLLGYRFVGNTRRLFRYWSLNRLVRGEGEKLTEAGVVLPLLTEEK